MKQWLDRLHLPTNRDEWREMSRINNWQVFLAAMVMGASFGGIRESLHWPLWSILPFLPLMWYVPRLAVFAGERWGNRMIEAELRADQPVAKDDS